MLVITGVAIGISEVTFMEFLKSTYKQEETVNKDKNPNNLEKFYYFCIV